MRKIGIISAVIWVIMSFAGFSLVKSEDAEQYYTEEERVELEQRANEDEYYTEEELNALGIWKERIEVTVN